MTLRAAILDPTSTPRPSARVSTVVGLLDCDASQVRRLVADGELEAHTIGKRGVRIYLDSVADYQARQVRPAERSPKKAAPDRVRASTAAHRSAMAYLHTLKVL